MARKLLTITFLLAGLVVLDARELAIAQQAAGAKPVYLTVILPEDDAELVIEGGDTKQSGLKRRFVSPPLDQGASYIYTVVATWEPNNYTKITRTKKVTVRAGQEVEVDMTTPNPKEKDKILIRYVPTPDEIVEQMCKLGRVTKDDLVYDLGCGDGRMVITAVKKFSAKRGVGVDIDPERVKESKENVKKADVEDRVEIRLGDVLKIDDLKDANVILLYMGDEVNLLLRPILQKTLRPGSRIVSHRFLMGDWKPHKTITVMDNEGEEYDLHLWEIGKP